MTTWTAGVPKAAFGATSSRPATAFPFPLMRFFPVLRPGRPVMAYRRLAAVGGAVILLIAGGARGGFDMDRMRQVAQLRFGAAAAEAVDGWRSAVVGWRDLPEDVQLQRVNEFFNRRVRFAEDSQVWGQTDYWATPLEVLAGRRRLRGPCLRQVFHPARARVAEDRLRMTYVRARIGGARQQRDPGAHGAELLRHARRGAAGARQPGHRHPAGVGAARSGAGFQFQHAGHLRGRATQASQPVDRVSRWREMLLRMNAEGLRD